LISDGAVDEHFFIAEELVEGASLAEGVAERSAVHEDNLVSHELVGLLHCRQSWEEH
jgi:hypothetical protein